ncbi:hypothetical protein [Paraeggerthella sp.]|uniref:hypothetical protein n=1 Tax=Paraeggerthella sp. TaxID=2897350 RepID=UPI003AB53C6D
MNYENGEGGIGYETAWALADGKVYTVDSVHIRRSSPGNVNVGANLADESNVIVNGTRPIAVDMQLMGYALNKKATA